MAQAAARIVKTPEVIGGKPRIDGTRLSVYYVREQIEGRGIDPQTLAAEHDLDVADVYHALAYFHDHPDEMEEIRIRRDRLVEGARNDPRIATGPDDLGEPRKE